MITVMMTIIIMGATAIQAEAMTNRFCGGLASAKFLN